MVEAVLSVRFRFPTPCRPAVAFSVPRRRRSPAGVHNLFCRTPRSRGMLITVSGPPGSGKTTAADELAERLGLEHVSGGDIFRALADERGYTPLEFNHLAEEDDQIDRDLDRRLREVAVERDDVVLESRLAGWLAAEHADLRIWLDAPLDVRAERIADREGKAVADARTETAARAESEAKRYRDYYGIDVDDLSIYDLVLNTARWNPEQELELLVGAIESYDPAVDEGKHPVTGVEYDFG
ncbi:MAG: AAA family ATPase [Halobacteriales archaeon]